MFKAVLRQFDYEILDTVTDGNEAVVSVKVQSVQPECVLAQLMPFAFGAAFAEQPPTETTRTAEQPSVVISSTMQPTNEQPSRQKQELAPSLVIETHPSSASIILKTDTGEVHEGAGPKAVFHLPDGQYDYTVHAAGFTEEHGTVTVSSETVLEVTLERPPRLTIQPDPQGAHVTVDGRSYAGAVSVPVPQGEHVTVHVTAPRYQPYRETLTITQNHTLNVELEPLLPVPVTIEVDPPTATVHANGEQHTSPAVLHVLPGDALTYEVTATQYAAYTSTVNVTEATELQVNLTPLVEVTITTDPSCANVWIEGHGESISPRTVSLAKGSSANYRVTSDPNRYRPYEGTLLGEPERNVSVWLNRVPSTNVGAPLSAFVDAWFERAVTPTPCPEGHFESYAQRCGRWKGGVDNFAYFLGHGSEARDLGLSLQPLGGWHEDPYRCTMRGSDLWPANCTVRAGFTLNGKPFVAEAADGIIKFIAVPHEVALAVARDGDATQARIEAGYAQQAQEREQRLQAERTAATSGLTAVEQAREYVRQIFEKNLIGTRQCPEEHLNAALAVCGRTHGDPEAFEVGWDTKTTWNEYAGEPLTEWQYAGPGATTRTYLIQGRALTVLFHGKLGIFENYGEVYITMQ